jgi:hypothetical protein
MSGGRIGGLGPRPIGRDDEAFKPPEVAPEQPVGAAPETVAAPPVEVIPGDTGPGSGRAKTSGFYRADLIQFLLSEAIRPVSLSDSVGHVRALETSKVIEGEAKAILQSLEPGSSANPTGFESQIAKRVQHYSQFHVKTAGKLEQDLATIQEELKVPDPRSRGTYEKRADELRGRLDAQLDQFRYDVGTDMGKVLDQLRPSNPSAADRVRAFLPLWLQQALPEPQAMTFGFGG